MVLSKKGIGLLIKKARKHKSEIIGKKYTQNMLAKDLDISRGYIGDIENGRIYPNYVLLNKIAEACEVSLSFFDNKNKEITYETKEENADNSTVCESSSTYYSSITDVKKAMEFILSQPGLILNGEMLSNDSKIALANAIQMGLAYAEQIQSKRKK